VAFDTDTRYRLRANDCYDASCEEHGSYRFDRAARSLNLTKDGSGRSYSLPLEILASRDAIAATPGPVSTRTTSALPGQLRVASDDLTDRPSVLIGEPTKLLTAVELELLGKRYVAPDTYCDRCTAERLCAHFDEPNTASCITECKRRFCESDRPRAGNLRCYEECTARWSGGLCGAQCQTTCGTKCGL
jgi:hypothetical protein